jgi:uncharacterized protein (TIGR02246 family)
MSAQTAPTSLEERVQLLQDRAEISDLMLAFGAALDAKDWGAYAATLTEDASFTILGQTRRGRAAIEAGPARDLERFDALQHFSTNHRIAVDGDEASARHYLIAVHVPDLGEPRLHADLGGRYDCRCVRTEDGWRFAAVELSTLWSAGEEFAIEPQDR